MSRKKQSRCRAQHLDLRAGSQVDHRPLYTTDSWIPSLSPACPCVCTGFPGCGSFPAGGAGGGLLLERESGALLGDLFL